MSTWKHYCLAYSLDEALHALADSPGPARPVAGGTDLLLELQQGHHPPLDTLVDITHIPGLSCLEIRGDELFIGAAVPVSDISESALVMQHAQAVAEACALIGGPQVRNTATLGGNVAHALPAADGMIGLVAVDAQVEIAAVDGLRRAPILSLFKGPGQSTLIADREILVGFYLPLSQQGQASAFLRIMRPQGVALPVINLAVWLDREGDRFKDVRIAVGPAGPTPRRAYPVEDCLRGAVYGDDTLACAGQVWAEHIHFRTSPQRATSAYRSHLSGFLLEDVLQIAWQRASLPSEAE